MTATVNTTVSPTPISESTTTAPTRTASARIPLTRIVGVELRKMFDTRSGFWLMASIVITSVLATAAIIVFAPDDQLTFDNFAAAIGAPMTVILPMIGILAATTVGVAAMFIALVVGVLGTLVGSAIAGVDPVWNVSAIHFTLIVLGSVLGMLFGFMLGLVIRNSAGAIVTYFVYTLVLPPLLGLLAANQKWFADLQPWVDYNYAQRPLFDGDVSSQQWQHLAVTGALWFLMPLVIGLLIVRRAEVK